MAMIHLLGSMAFAKNNISPNTAKLNPRVFNKKGKAKRATNVLIRFFQFNSENPKIRSSFSPGFVRLEIIRFDREKTPSKKAARKGRKPAFGFPKLPKDALTEEIRMTPATTNKKMLLIWSFFSLIIDDTRFENWTRFQVPLINTGQNSPPFRGGIKDVLYPDPKVASCTLRIPVLAELPGIRFR
jgi:hypothetical protein